MKKNKFREKYKKVKQIENQQEKKEIKQEKMKEEKVKEEKSLKDIFFGNKDE